MGQGSRTQGLLCIQCYHEARVILMGYLNELYLEGGTNRKKLKT